MDICPPSHERSAAGVWDVGRPRRGSGPSGLGDEPAHPARSAPSYIPMAPNTALAFIVLAWGCLLSSTPGRGPVDWPASVPLVAAVGVLRLGEYATGLEFAVDHWFFRVRDGQLGLLPSARCRFPPLSPSSPPASRS